MFPCAMLKRRVIGRRIYRYVHAFVTGVIVMADSYQQAVQTRFRLACVVRNLTLLNGVSKMSVPHHAGQSDSSLIGLRGTELTLLKGISNTSVLYHAGLSDSSPIGLHGTESTSFEMRHWTGLRGMELTLT